SPGHERGRAAPFEKKAARPFLRSCSAFVLTEVDADILRHAAAVQQQERALSWRARGFLELLCGVLRRRDRLLVDRQHDVAARQAERVGGAAVIDGCNHDTVDVAAE